MPSQITKGSATSSVTTTTLYVGSYEKDVTGVNAEHKHPVGDFLLAVYRSADNSWSWRYLHRDHLGSVVTVTDASGVLINSLSYDAWGQRQHTAVR